MSGGRQSQHHRGKQAGQRPNQKQQQQQNYIGNSAASQVTLLHFVMNDKHDIVSIEIDTVE